MSRKETIADLGIRAIFMAVIYIIFASMLPSYHTVAGIGALLDGAVLIGLVAVGIGVTMLAGEFDLSVGSLAAVIGVLAVNLIITGMSIAPAVLIAVAAGGVFGGLQGLVIAVTGINSLVFTIGTLIGLRGFALIISGENSVTIPIPRLVETDFFAIKILGILTPLSIIMFAVFILVGLFLSYTVWGREIYAIGGGRAEARAAGVSIVRPMVIAFALSGTLAGLGGALLSVRLGSATPLGFDTLLLSAVTACLMGGIALEGGRGTVFGIFIGLLTMRFLVGGVSSIGAPYWLQSLAIGALLIFAIVIQMGLKLHRRHRSRPRPRTLSAQPG
ncbi:MAG: ABC transporter permease [Bauldia sp.]|nr:ABC transporter permease [Bauldia sp.]